MAFGPRARLEAMAAVAVHQYLESDAPLMLVDAINVECTAHEFYDWETRQAAWEIAFTDAQAKLLRRNDPDQQDTETLRFFDALIDPSDEALGGQGLYDTPE